VAITGDSAQTIEFLIKWAPDSPWVLSAVDPERKKGMITNTFDINTKEQALAFIEHWNGKRNIYFMVNAARFPLTKKAEKNHVGWMTAIHVDVDPVDPPTDCTDIPHHYIEQNEVIRARLNEYAVPPSIIIFSGGGFQAFWLLREAVEIDEPTADAPEPWTKLEAYNRRPEHDLGGDHCFNIDRIMRLPGTVNLPDAKKKLKGRVPALAVVESANWDTLYELTDFTPWVEEPKGKKKASPKKAGKKSKKDDNWVDRVLQNGPDHEGPRSFGGDRSRAMWAVACALVRRGLTDEEIIALITDKANKLSEHIYHQNNPAKYAQRQVDKAREEAGHDLVRDDNDKVIVNQENIRIALGLVEVRLSYNAFNRKDMIEGPHGKPLRVLQQSDVTMTWLLIEEECYFRPSKAYFEDVVSNECKANSFHPVRDYLDNLKHDGKPRIDTWLTDYAGAADTPYTRASGALMLIAAVRRIRQPGCKFDEMMIFESPQGTNKSTALGILSVNPEWFSDSLPLDADDKQVIEVLDGKWIIEAPELKGLHRKGMEHLKAFLSRQVDRARLSYDSIISEVPRQSVIFASTNSKNYLSDNTGNRRMLPIGVEQFDVVSLARDVHQLWAEANAREAAGESIRLDPALYGEAAEQQNERLIEDPWEPLIEMSLGSTPTGKVLSTDLWHIVNIPVGMRTQLHNVRLGDSMRALGWGRVQLKFTVDGKKKNRWCYAKGDANQRAEQILIRRDGYGMMTVQYASGGMPLDVDDFSSEPGSGDKDIPF